MGYLTESVPSAKATENKKYQTWSKEIRIGDLTKRLQVEEVSNGFLIPILNMVEKKVKKSILMSV